MKITTILNAMKKVRVGSGWDMDRRIRQYNAFHARILRMMRSNHRRIDALTKEIYLNEQALAHQDRQLAKKNTRIESLEEDLYFIANPDEEY